MAEWLTYRPHVPCVMDDAGFNLPLPHGIVESLLSGLTLSMCCPIKLDS